jgi:hypothetical protein
MEGSTVNFSFEICFVVSGIKDEQTDGHILFMYLVQKMHTILHFDEYR